ncbi:ABC transporter permease [Methanolobus sp. ZRKC5]|uniref:fluoroquinolone export ABC transporter permease subunit n=1 Tax=Methanolobus sp. ZRKC5 TaxID=3136295 RepID=UPI00313E685E
MNRLFSAVRTDVTVQLRNNLYTIGIIAGILVAVAISQVAGPDQLQSIVPALMLMVAGGSTLLYVAGMIIFEKDEGTLNAIIVSPLRTSEYLLSKVITLTALATLESFVMIGGTMLIMSFQDSVSFPNIPLLLIGIIAIGVIYTLIGIILIVRFDRITDFLIPMSVVAVLLQLPFLYFLGWIVHPLFLIIPTSAPAMLMLGAYVQLTSWQWTYATVYTGIQIAVLSVWASRAFKTHIILKVN